MKFIKPTFKYIYKNFLYLALIVLVPSIFIGALLSPFKIVEFVNIYSGMPILNFGTIFTNIIDFGFIELILILTGMVLLAIFIGGLLGQIEQHFRSGKFSLASFKNNVNNNVLIVGVNLLAGFLILLLLAIITSGLIFFAHLIISGLYISPTVFNVVVANVLVSLSFVVFSIILALLLINTANMLFDGSQFKSSLGTSVRLMQKNTFSLILAVLLPLVIMSVLVSIFLNTSLLVFINILGTAFLILYYTSLAMVTYYQLSSTPRYDMRKKYYSK